MSGWWRDRWLTWLRTLELGPATDSQLKSAERAEGELTLRRGRLSAKVWVGEWRDVTATLQVQPWTDRRWRQTIDLLVEKPTLAQQLLSGSFGADLAEALAEAEIELFPQELSVGCSCGNRSGSCRHLNYLAVQMADRLDANPFLWLEVLGRPRSQLLAEVRAALADQAGRDAGEGGREAAVLSLERFWHGEVDATDLPDSPDLSDSADYPPSAEGSQGGEPADLLRSLGPLPWEEALRLPPDRIPVTPEAVLQGMVREIAAGAQRLLAGEHLPEVEQGEATITLPGRRISLTQRLLPEMVAQVQGSDRLHHLEELYQASPTARAIQPQAQAMRAMREALQQLPPGLIQVAGRYVGPPEALLAGARFCHVVTFDEWADGVASPDADWARALLTAGWEVPNLAAAFARLRPDVGDELWIEMLESGPRLELVRRPQRDLGRQLAADGTAAQLLQILIGQMQVDRLTEQEAVAALLAEGGYREGLFPDPIWLLPMLGLGLYQEPSDRVITRLPTGWRSGPPRFVYGNWRQDRALQAFHTWSVERGRGEEWLGLADQLLSQWCRYWPAAQDEPAGADSLGPFLQFLWTQAPLQSEWERLGPEGVPQLFGDWFTFLEEAYPQVAGRYQRHRLACGLREHWQERHRAAAPARAQGKVHLPWLVESLRWIGPGHYVKYGNYR